MAAFRKTLAAIVASTAFMLGGCSNDDSSNSSGHDHGKHSGHGAPKAAAVATANIVPSKAATTQPTLNKVNGLVTFTQMGDKVKVNATVSGLKPNSKHGFHVHEKGDMSAADLMSTGGHFNPHGHDHGAPNGKVHGGDFGNLSTDGKGNATLELVVEGISVGTGAKDDVVGKAVIVHEKEDDLKTQPTGNAGGRVAGGLIELKK